jgi:hypothetical protein
MDKNLFKMTTWNGEDCSKIKGRIPVGKTYMLHTINLTQSTKPNPSTKIIFKIDNCNSASHLFVKKLLYMHQFISQVGTIRTLLV